MIYVVQPGDSLYSIARSLGIREQALADQNMLERPDRLVAGQTLLALTPSEVYMVQSGDTIYSIARRHVTLPINIYRNNPQLLGQPHISPGQLLIIRYAEQQERGLFTVNGYTYIFIDRDLLRSVLPYLTTVSNFTYSFTEQGDLIPLPDVELLLDANAVLVGSMLVLAPVDENGGFDSQLLSVLANPEASERLIANTVHTAINKGYTGVDLDFEFIPAELADAYVEFATAMANRLHIYGLTLNISLAPKISDDQPGLLYEGIDYARLGQAADTVLLMTYEWGYTYGPPMPVAPLPEVRRVVEYALTRIPAEKILLGIPNYGYDWTLPYEQGRAALSISNPEAIELAWRHGATISYDQEAQSPYFYYFTPKGVSHVVWFEDLRSMQAKFDLALELGLRGVSFWTIARPFPANWLNLSSQFAIDRW